MSYFDPGLPAHAPVQVHLACCAAIGTPILRGDFGGSLSGLGITPTYDSSDVVEGTWCIAPEKLSVWYSGTSSITIKV